MAVKTVTGKTVGQRYRDAALAEQAVIGVLDVVQIMGLPRELIDAVYVAHERREDLYTALADREAARYARLVAIDELPADPSNSTREELALIELIEARDQRVEAAVKGTDLPPQSPRTHARQLLAALDAARESRGLRATEAILLRELEEHGALTMEEIGERLHWSAAQIDDCLRRLHEAGAIEEIVRNVGVIPASSKWRPVEGWSGLTGRIER